MLRDSEDSESNEFDPEDSDSDDCDEEILLFLLLMRRARRRLQAANRTQWSTPWILRRDTLGVHENLVCELAAEDPKRFRRYHRVNREGFDEILAMISPLIIKEDTCLRMAIKPSERLSVTLRFLATGETFRSLSFQYRIEERTISAIVEETCQALHVALKEKYLKTPSSASKEDCEVHYHIIGDDAFPLSKNMMKPYPHRNLERLRRIFNYRLSRARRVVENAFGILAHRWRVFLTPMNMCPDKVTDIIFATYCLHNYLVEKNKGSYTSAADMEMQITQFRKECGEMGKCLQACRAALTTIRLEMLKTNVKSSQDILTMVGLCHGRTKW
eukprot:gene10419-11510_t